MTSGMKETRNKLRCNRLRLNVFSLNVLTSPSDVKKRKGYGLDNYLWDDGNQLLWDNAGVVLTDR